MKKINKMISLLSLMPLVSISCSNASIENNVHIDLHNDNSKIVATSGSIIGEPAISSNIVSSSFLIDDSFPSFVPRKIIENLWGLIKDKNLLIRNFSITLKKEESRTIVQNLKINEFLYREYNFKLDPHDNLNLESIIKASKGVTLETKTATLLLNIPFVSSISNHDIEVLIPCQGEQLPQFDREFCEKISTKIINFRSAEQDDFESINRMHIKYINVEKMNNINPERSAIFKEESFNLSSSLKQNLISPWEIGNLLNIRFNKFYLPEVIEQIESIRKTWHSTLSATVAKKFERGSGKTKFDISDIGLTPPILPSTISMEVENIFFTEKDPDDNTVIINQLTATIIIKEEHNPQTYKFNVEFNLV